jgi:hypothetical protein
MTIAYSCFSPGKVLPKGATFQNSNEMLFPPKTLPGEKQL